MLRNINKLVAYVLLFFLLFSLAASALPAGNAHAASAPPVLTPRTSPAPDTAHDVEINFAANSAWTSAITGVYDGGTPLTANSQYVIYPAAQSGNQPSVMILAGVLSAGTHTIKVTAAGYADAATSVTVTAAAITPNKKLQNGGFETPPISASTTPGSKTTTPGAWNYYRDDADGIGWKTTATDHYIEFRNDIKSNSNSSIPIPEGGQFAELNAQFPSSLYQDILTNPGTTVNWRLYHRGRNGTDTMKVQIGPPGGPSLIKRAIRDR
ncbi:DUF1533 domain-containing protein [Paenibacillus sp. P26]|nr:DUF1533 domain-containing protein [Paenibacillus sp. P26]